MPFGLKKAPAAYVRLITNVLGPIMQANGEKSHVSNFFDGVAVAGVTWRR